MIVSGHFARQQSDTFNATQLAEIVERQPGPLPWMHWSASLQIRKRESTLPITPISRTQQRKESGILAQRQQLAIAECPTCGRKVEWENSDFSDKRISHVFSPLLSLRWENSLECDTEIESKERLHVRMRLTTTNITNSLRVHHGVWCARRPLRLSVIGPVVTTRSALICVRVGIDYRHIVAEKMRMSGQLLLIYGYCGTTCSLTQGVAVAFMDWHPPPYVGEREIRLPISPIHRSHCLLYTSPSPRDS